MEFASLYSAAVLALVGALLGCSALVAWRYLILPGLAQPRFSVRSTALDLVGAVLFISISYEIIDRSFTTSGLGELIGWMVILMATTLGLAGLLVVLMLGLAARFVLRLWLVFPPRPVN